jgi:hypothetical protein
MFHGVSSSPRLIEKLKRAQGEHHQIGPGGASCDQTTSAESDR